MARSAVEYICAWCGRQGSRIAEQAVACHDPVTGRPVTRYVCWLCGQDVQPLRRSA